MTAFPTDRGGNPYIQVRDWFRVSRINRPDGSFDIRFNVLTEKGKVCRGPQIGVEDIGELFQAVANLIREE